MSVSPGHRVSTGERLNTSETTGKLQQAIRERGIRLTRQRRVILEVMDAAEQHLDVDQILERARATVRATTFTWHASDAARCGSLKAGSTSN
jgi:hypothetical protein